MSAIHDLATLFEWREKLAAIDVPIVPPDGRPLCPDDLDDEAVMREARLRTMGEMLRRCPMASFPWTRRLVRDLPEYPAIVDERREREVSDLWGIYRRELAAVRATGHPWPDFLPPIPEDSPLTPP